MNCTVPPSHCKAMIEPPPSHYKTMIEPPPSHCKTMIEQAMTTMLSYHYDFF